MTCGINGLFFKGDLKDFISEDWFDPQPDSAIQPKARGLLHMEREGSRFWGLSTSQPRSNRKYLEDYLTYLKEGPEATRRVS